MCGIVGLFAKSREIEDRLGEHLTKMLIEMEDRGPDSAGVAFYRDPVGEGWVKLSVTALGDTRPWADVSAGLHTAFPEVSCTERGSHAVLKVKGDFEAVRAWLAHHHPEVRIVSAGDAIEIFKEKGLPRDVADAFALREITGTHALGHTRMATESAVTTAHSHPFSTGMDLCLVHNGSLSNHNRLRERLRRLGITFQTDNDSEVAAGFLTERMRAGASLREALDAALRALDGFYTFAIGTHDGFAVVRDPIACKHAVLAETDDWVAMATEFRAIAALPGAETARVWEPDPGRVYIWHRDGEGRVVGGAVQAEVPA
ncbi:N-methylglutamate synthase subunit A [Limimonas halophila]|uniref:N-methylglutamate synthase subunit A n=1 Tax=Limimonas halophila TaxID=1082479 RepID=A0A1G7S250_9PROT|nr:class II glutamine amidotransferase [Limimonas halophila]SDG16519.1 N-methylglutamate synthase subunit A [Limimonas halophila]